ncbi:hypothetical protein [Aquimarina algiphila]|nr:hypothetical protein [Aquimarina algiphila]
MPNIKREFRKLGNILHFQEGINSKTLNQGRKILLFLLSLSLFSCVDDYENQVDGLLPNTEKIVLKDQVISAISSFSKYTFTEKLHEESLKSYPVNLIKDMGWNFKSWKNANNYNEQEKNDIIKFLMNFKKEFDNDKKKRVARKIDSIIYEINKSKFIAAYCYKKTKIGDKNFGVDEWRYFYFLNIEGKELICLNYGAR